MLKRVLLLCVLRQSAALNSFGRRNLIHTTSLSSFASTSASARVGYSFRRYHYRGRHHWVRNPSTRRRPIFQATFVSMANPRSNDDLDRRVGGQEGMGAPASSIERLCRVSLRACQLMNPLIDAIYRQLLVSSNKESDDHTTSKSNIKKTKKDNSAFTIADGMVQRLLIDVLFSNVAFRDVVGEEDEEDNHSNARKVDTNDDDDNASWFQIQGLAIPMDLRPLVESTRADIKSLAEEYSPHSSTATDTEDYYRNITVFIDPIDGTREFSTGKGEQCSVCIGFVNEHGRPVGGVVYRPLSHPGPTWVAGVASEGYVACDFGKIENKLLSSSTSDDDGNKKRRGGLLTTNGSISPFVESLMEELQTERVKSGGAGNKMMMLLENSVSSTNCCDGADVDVGDMLYIQDRGVSRWDTCAAEACLEAFGGKLLKLTHFLSQEAQEEGDKDENSGELYYTYLASRTNLDFIPGSANLTKYNCRKSPTKELQQSNSQKALNVDQVKPYSNLCGLVALGKEWNTKEGMTNLRAAIERAATRNYPSFD